MNTNGQVFQLSGLDEGGAPSTVEERVRGILTSRGIATAADSATYTVQDPAPGLPDDLRFTLYDVISTSDQGGVELAIEPAQPSLFRRVKQAFHQLVIFYVNKAVGQQVGFNTAAARALTLLAMRIAANETEIAALRRELETLRAQMGQAHHE
jgi:hypothetical protein